MKKRIWTDAHPDVRCEKTVTLKDGSKAQCGRQRAPGSHYCKQHIEYLRRHALS